MNATHHCHAEGCTQPVPPELLMCRPHWFKVPKPIRDRIWSAFRPAQCVDKDPSLLWCLAADEAVAYIAELERKTVRITFAGAFYPTGIPA